jgi:ribosomal protein S18 acetylase RimI-like enzyme
MSVDIAELAIVEIGKPAEDEQAAMKIAHFVLSELYRCKPVEPSRMAAQLETMAEMVTLAVSDGSKVLATGSLQTAPSLLRAAPSRTTLEGIVVADDYARLGLGSRIVGALEERGRRAGVERIEVVPASTAWGFYERLGYTTLTSRDPTYLFKSLTQD